MVATAEAQTLEFRIVRQVKTQPPLTFTVQITYDPDDKVYLVKCHELDVVTWGEDWDDAVESLVDGLLLVADSLLEVRGQRPELQDERLAHAKFIAALGSEEKIRKVLGL